MKDSDLESKIKALRTPERDGEYWEAFPQRVLAELRAGPVEQLPRHAFMPGLFFAGRVALACFILTFCLWQSRMPQALSHTLRQDERELRQSVTRIENNLDKLMQDEHGLDKLVADQP